MGKSITIRGGAANRFMAALLVDQHGENATKNVKGPMLEAVKAELKKRGIRPNSDDSEGVE